MALHGGADNWDFRKDDEDYYTQPGDLFRLMKPEQQKVLFENTGRAMSSVSVDVKIRHIKNCLRADKAYGEGVAKALGVSLSDVK